MRTVGYDSLQGFTRHWEKMHARNKVDIRALNAFCARPEGKVEQTPVPKLENLAEGSGRDQEELEVGDGEPGGVGGSLRIS